MVDNKFLSKLSQMKVKGKNLQTLN